MCAIGRERVEMEPGVRAGGFGLLVMLRAAKSLLTQVLGIRDICHRF